MTNEKIINTTINGLKIKINKVVKDQRGILCELAPDGINNSFFIKPIKNIHVSIITKKNIFRAGHYHFHNIENFYTLFGTTLWFFRDYRKDSSTFKKNYYVILGFDKLTSKTDVPTYTIDNGQMAQVLVPAGIYHIFWSLTKKPVIVLDVATEPYNKEDYERPKLEHIQGIKKLLDKFSID